MTDIVIEINGVRYSYFKSASVTKSLETMCGKFEFTASGGINEDFPIKAGDTCKIKIDDNAILTGYIEHLALDLDSGTDEITISGRDRTADIVDSELGEDINLSPPTDLYSLTKKILSILNITNIDVVQLHSVNKKYSDIITIEPGTKAFDYLHKYTHKAQVLMTSNGDGNIVFLRQNNQTLLKTLLSTAPDTPARIIKRNYTIDFTKRFYKYIFKNQNNDSNDTVFFTTLQKKATDDSGEAFDNEIRKSRILYEISDHATSSVDTTLEDRAKWEANFRKAQAFAYECTIASYYAEDDKVLWQPLQLVKVQDPKAGLNRTMLITEVTYSLSDDDGPTTKLKLLPRDAFTLEVNRPDKEQDGEQDKPVYFTKSQKISGQPT